VSETVKLVIDSFGVFLGRKGQRFTIRDPSGRRNEVNAADVEEIHLVSPGVSISVSAIRLALHHGVLIVYGRRDGWPIGFTIPAVLTGTIKARREQYRGYNDIRGVELAKSFAKAKTFNQASMLRLLAKNRKWREPELAADLYESAEKILESSHEIGLVKGDRVDQVRESIINKEAEAARVYWSAIVSILPSELGFRGRITRGATDPFNMLLNYGYKAILFTEVWKAVYYAGLDPYAGYLHTDRSGRPSFVLDLMEEFRQETVDRVLLGIVNRGQLKAGAIIGDDGRLEKSVSKLVFKVVSERLDEYVSYGGGRLRLRDTIMLQARTVSRYLLGELPAYTPYMIR
jgi:CRISPR-associated protein Cas1